MATTGIWKISDRLDNVIKYTTNVEKTFNDEYTKEPYCNLHNVIDYVEADYKTEKQFYVTGINCSSERALEEMIITKKAFNKTGGSLGFHAFQSFKKGEVTPELAHSIGVKLAEEMWGDRFEVVVSTHLNTEHYHNHFVINSVSFVDGKRYYDKRGTYAELRRISDLICEEYGLSVLQEKACKKSKINYANYQISNWQNNSYYSIAKRDLDIAIAQAYDIKDFEKMMRAMDYEVIYRYNKISIRRKGYKKNIRIERCFGYDYSIDRIINRIEIESAPRIPFIEVFGNVKYQIDNTNYKKPLYSGIYGLYLHYCYLLKVFPNKYPRQQLSAEIRADINKMDKISEEARLLVSNELTTDKQFFCFKKEKESKLNLLLNQRSKLWYRHKLVNDSEKVEISKQIQKLNLEIEPLRKEVVLCDEIVDRSKIIEQKISSLDEDKGKEMKKNEFFR